MNFDFEQEPSKAQYDQGLSLVFILAKIKLKCIDACEKVRGHDPEALEEWYAMLDSYYRTLYPVLNEKEEGQRRTIVDDMELEYDKFLKDKKKMTQKLFTLMRDYELFLRKCEHTHGLYLKTMDDPGLAMG